MKLVITSSQLTITDKTKSCLYPVTVPKGKRPKGVPHQGNTFLVFSIFSLVFQMFARKNKVRLIVRIHAFPWSGPSVCSLFYTIHAINLPGLPLYFVYCKQSETEWWEPGNKVNLWLSSAHHSSTLTLASNPGFPLWILSRSFG